MRCCCMGGLYVIPGGCWCVAMVTAVRSYAAAKGFLEGFFF